MQPFCSAPQVFFHVASMNMQLAAQLYTARRGVMLPSALAMVTRCVFIADVKIPPRTEQCTMLQF